MCVVYIITASFSSYTHTTSFSRVKSQCSCKSNHDDCPANPSMYCKRQGLTIWIRYWLQLKVCCAGLATGGPFCGGIKLCGCGLSDGVATAFTFMRPDHLRLNLKIGFFQLYVNLGPFQADQTANTPPGYNICRMACRLLRE